MMIANMRPAFAEKAERSPWELAAGNWENAARARSDEALRLLSQADQSRKTEPANNAKLRRVYFERIGKTEMSAAGLFAVARGNFDKAAASWDKAAAAYRKGAIEASARQAALRCSEAKSSAVHACFLAAQSYERAAQAYSLGYANNPLQSAAASEKAAQCREIIARLRPA